MVIWRRAMIVAMAVIVAMSTIVVIPTVMAIAMIVEPLLLIAGRKKLITRLQRQLRAERATP